MRARMREMDWSRTPIGPPEQWPQSLRSTVSMLLPSRAQIALFWGPSSGSSTLGTERDAPVRRCF